jgi:hypothetical protein
MTEVGLPADEHEDRTRSRVVLLWQVTALVLLVARFGVPELRGGRPTGPAWTGLLTITALWLLIGVLGWAARALPLRQTVRTLGPVRAGAAGGVVGLLLLAHHVPATDLEPFTPWVMYTTPVAAVVYYELTAVADAEPLEALPIDRAVERSTARPVHSRFGVWAERAADGDLQALAQLTEAVEAVLRVGGRDEADSVRVGRCVVEDPQADAPARCEPLITLDVRPDRAT